MGVLDIVIQELEKEFLGVQEDGGLFLILTAVQENNIK